MSKKNAQVANFNIVFGDKEEPMLRYFDIIIHPALTAHISKVSNDNEYMFKNIEVEKNKNGICVLKGILVKKTILEIKSDLTEDGELIEKDERYSAAPYSVFAVNLLNHRMIFMPNQKGSPTLANFRSTLKHVINKYTAIQNKKLDEEHKLTYALINIVGIPSAKTMDELLKNVKKINSLTLRFYPLNGDIDYTEAFGILTTDMRNEVGCKNGEIVFKSPKSIEGIKKILEKAAGTIDPILQVVTKEGSKVRMKGYELSEKYELDFDEDADIETEGNYLVDKMSTVENLTFRNSEHDKIYKDNEEKIIPFIKKR